MSSGEFGKLLDRVPVAQAYLQAVGGSLDSATAPTTAPASSSSAEVPTSANSGEGCGHDPSDAQPRLLVPPKRSAASRRRRPANAAEEDLWVLLYQLLAWLVVRTGSAAVREEVQAEVGADAADAELRRESVCRRRVHTLQKRFSEVKPALKELWSADFDEAQLGGFQKLKHLARDVSEYVRAACSRELPELLLSDGAGAGKEVAAEKGPFKGEERSASKELVLFVVTGEAGEASAEDAQENNKGSVKMRGKSQFSLSCAPPSPRELARAAARAAEMARTKAPTPTSNARSGSSGSKTPLIRADLHPEDPQQRDPLPSSTTRARKAPAPAAGLLSAMVVPKISEENGDNTLLTPAPRPVLKSGRAQVQYYPASTGTPRGLAATLVQPPKPCAYHHGVASYHAHAHATYPLVFNPDAPPWSQAAAVAAVPHLASSGVLVPGTAVLNSPCTEEATTADPDSHRAAVALENSAPIGQWSVHDVNFLVQQMAWKQMVAPGSTMGLASPPKSGISAAVPVESPPGDPPDAQLPN